MRQASLAGCLLRSLAANIVVAATTNVARVITGLSCELSLSKLFAQRDGVSRRAYDGRGAAALEKGSIRAW
jgi:hypothetical protein